MPDNSVNFVNENFAVWEHTLKSGFFFSEEKEFNLSTLRFSRKRLSYASVMGM